MVRLSSASLPFDFDAPHRRERASSETLKNSPPHLPSLATDDAPSAAQEAKDLEKRIHTISGRVAQLDMNLRSTCDDLTSLNDSLKRLTKTVEGLPQGSDERVAAERSL